MTYPINTAVGDPTVGYGPPQNPQQQPSPWAPAGPYNGGRPNGLPQPPQPQQPTPRKRSGLWRSIAVAGAIIVAAVGGGAVGALITNSAQPQPNPPAAAPAMPPEAAPSADTIHTQDVQLCTAYAIINTATPKPDTRGMDLLPSATAIQNAIAAHSDASMEVRDALGAVVDSYYARIAAYVPVRTRGLAEPPAYDMAAAQASYDRAWSVCRLDG